MTMDIEELERLLDGGAADQRGPDLAAIRQRGRRHRRVRVVAVAGGTAAAVALVGGLAAVVLGGPADDRTGVVVAEPTATPKEPSPLAQRVLAEVPGARQVGTWQVVVPGPDADPWNGMGRERVELVGAPVPLGASAYAGVTAYETGVFPAWLHEGVAAEEKRMGAEQADPDDPDEQNSHPVGSTDMGILVDRGQAALGCHAWLNDDGSVDRTKPCHPVFLAPRADGTGWTFEWGMGTDRFLDTGAPMEVFTSDDFNQGVPGTLGIAGLDGTDVARAEFIAVDGTRVHGTVAAGSLVEGESMFWAAVPGELARVIAYDASGTVIEDHPLRDCDTPVDCEVR